MSTISPPSNKNAIKIAVAFAAIYIIWGTTYLAIRIAVETIPPFLMAGVRFVLAGLVTFVFLRARGVPLPTRKQWRSAAIIGAFLIVGGNGFVTWSEQQVPSGMAALIVATDPLWITLFDWLIFKGAKPGKRTVFGLILGFLGIGLLIGPGQLQGSSISLFSLAVLFMAPVLWSLGSLYSRNAELPENIFMATAVEMLCGGSFLIIAGLLTGEPSKLDLAGISLRSLTAMAYLTIFGSIVAFTAYVWLLKTVQAAKVSTYTFVNPVIAVFLGWLILSETITAQTLIAVPSIILAVVLITIQTTKKAGAGLEEGGTAVPRESTATD